MQDTIEPFDIALTDLRPPQWLKEIKDLGDRFGFFEPLDPDHNAVFVEKGDTLLVTFETLPGIQALTNQARPVGFDLAKGNDWSCLTVIANHDTWFRDGAVYGFFDQLTDDGFFEDFDNVIFYGAGPCGYAACAFSVAAPGATVVALEPQATLDPRMTEWEDRFTEMRMADFTDRYGFAPDMLEAAQAAFVLYDPQNPLDAMHAALFQRPNVTRFRARHLGGGMQAHLMQMDVLPDIVTQAAAGDLTAATYATLYRKRRTYVPYVKRLFAAVEATDRPFASEAVCSYIVKQFGAPRYRRKLRAMRQARAAQETEEQQAAQG